VADELRIRRAVDARPGFDGLLIPWDTPGDVTDGRHRYRESWAPGSVTATGRVPVFDGHDPVTLQRGALIGAVEGLESRADGLHGRVELGRTGRAAEVRDLAELVDVGLSVEVLTDNDQATADSDGIVRRAAGRLVGLAVLLPPASPAFSGAAVTQLRAEPQPPTTTDNGEQTMPDTTDAPAVPAPTPAPAPATAGSEVPDGGALLQALEPAMRAAVEAEVARASMATSTPGHPAHPLARFRSLGEYAAHVLAHGHSDEAVFRALADQLTTDNPGVVPPGWVNEVFGIIDHAWPLLEALRRPAPAEGLDVNWPYFDGSYAALVGVQLAQKTPITSVKVNLKRGTEPLQTFAGGSDIAYQLLLRSSPEYLDAYMRIMATGYAWATGATLSTTLATDGTGSVTVDWATADDAAIRKAVFAASAQVAAATGSPASVVAAAEDVFGALGGALPPAVYGTQNVAGTATASTLEVNVSGLRVVLDLALPVGTALATNRQAAAWFEAGPYVITAEDVEKLGRDVAIWGLGAPAVMAAAGVVTMSALGAGTASSRRGSKE
jgi:hypothetical protein